MPTKSKSATCHIATTTNQASLLGERVVMGAVKHIVQGIGTASCLFKPSELAAFALMVLFTHKLQVSLIAYELLF